MDNQLTTKTLLNRRDLGSTSATLDSIPISIHSTFDNLDTCDGPVFANANDVRGWVKVNSVSACKVCRARHVRCSLYRTGGPCESCREHNTKCEVLGWVLDPKASPKEMYKSVLPPPPPGRVSPICGVMSNPRLFSPAELTNKLQWLLTAPTKITKRKPPMAWPEAQFSEEDPFSNPVQASGSVRQVTGITRIDSPCTKRMKRSPSFSYQEDERAQTPINSISTSPFNALDEGSSSPQSWSPNSNHQKKMSLSFILCSNPTSLSSEKSSNFTASENDHHDENQDYSFRSSCSSSSTSSTYSNTSSPTLSPRKDRVTWSSFHNLPSLPKIDLNRKTGYNKTSNERSERSERMIEFPEFLPKLSEKFNLNHWKCTF